MPSASALTNWAEQAPEGFQFSFKANRGIVRTKEFGSRTELLLRFCELLGNVGSHLGPVLFQFESRGRPNSRKFWPWRGRG